MLAAVEYLIRVDAQPLRSTIPQMTASHNRKNERNPTLLAISPTPSSPARMHPP
jgi:hypothetical protein